RGRVRGRALHEQGSSRQRAAGVDRLAFQRLHGCARRRVPGRGRPRHHRLTATGSDKDAFPHMKTAEIATRYLDHFRSKDHTIVPSASLVSDDPSLMFTVAGMVPFVPYLSGMVPAPYPRATSVQKCIRTNDIEEVGKTPRHGTFFQMCGNFSFGDYFKRGAI